MFFSEDKIIIFYLYLDVDEYNHCLDYPTDEWVLKDGIYYQATDDITSDEELIPGVDTTKWSEGTDCPPVFDLSLAQGFIVILYQNKDRTIEQYSKNADPDFQSITEVDFTKGIFSINLKSDKTKNLNERKVFADVKIRAQSDDFPDGFNTIATMEIDLAKDSPARYTPVPIL